MKHAAPLNDRWLFYYVYPVIAVAIVHIGNENSLSQLLRIPSYYSDLVLALALTFGMGYYYHRYYRLHPLLLEPASGRIGHLVNLLVLPIALVIGIELLYVVLLLGIPFRELSVFYLELPLVLLFSVLINVIYTGLIFQQRAAATEVLLGKERGRDEYDAFPGGFVVHAGARSFRVPVEEIAFFEVVEKTTFLVTAAGRRHLLDQPLREVQVATDPRQFFGLNRQVVAHRRSIAGYARTGTRKLTVDLHPAPDATPTVSKVKAGAFLRWLEEKEFAH